MALQLFQCTYRIQKIPDDDDDDPLTKNRNRWCQSQKSINILSTLYEESFSKDEIWIMVCYTHHCEIDIWRWNSLFFLFWEIILFYSA